MAKTNDPHRQQCLLDVWQSDPTWSSRSMAAIQLLAGSEELAINPIIFAEISVRFATHQEVEHILATLKISNLYLPNEAAFLAGKAFLSYRKLGGTKTGVLPDFFIGAHAAVTGTPLLTRDAARYKTYFPTVRLITP